MQSRARRWMRLPAALALSLSVLLPALAPVHAADKLVLNVGTLQDLDSLNPFQAVYVVSFEAFTLDYDLLVNFGANTEPVPGYAESWTVSPDGRVYTFKTRAGMKWSDGQPATAKDAAWTLNTIMKFAIQPSGGIGKYRAAGDAGHPRRVGKFVGRLRSECPGDVLLSFGKDVDSKMGCAGEGRIAACGLTDAYQNQRWIEGDRRKGVGRKAFRNSHRIEGGCHGDAGREAAERSSQFRYIHCSGVELLDFLTLHYGLSANGKLDSRVIVL